MHNIASAVPRSLSMQDLIKPASVTEIVGAIISSWRPGYLARTLLWQDRPEGAVQRPFAAAVASLKAQFMNYESTIKALHTRIDDLEYDKRILISDNKAYQSEITTLRVNISNAACDKILADRRAQETIESFTQAAKQDKAKIEKLESDIDNTRKFICYMVDIDLHTVIPLRNAAKETMDEHMDAEESLLKNIKRASKRRGSVWSRIAPAIPNSISPLETTSRSRKVLSNNEAQYRIRDPALCSIVTPVDVFGPAIRQKITDGDVLDDLMDMVKPIDTPFPPDFKMVPELQKVVEGDAKRFPRRASLPNPPIIGPTYSCDKLDVISESQEEILSEIAALLSPRVAQVPSNHQLSTPSTPSSIYPSSSLASFNTPRALEIDQFYIPQQSGLIYASQNSSPDSQGARSLSEEDSPARLLPRRALTLVDTNLTKSDTISKKIVRAERNTEKENIDPYKASRKKANASTSVDISIPPSTLSLSCTNGRAKRVSAKLLGKRNGIVLADNQDFAALATPSTTISEAASLTQNIDSQDTPTQQSISKICGPNTQIQLVQPQSAPGFSAIHSSSIDLAQEAVLHAEEISRSSGICAQSLEPLEHILSSMSSADLGSLEPSEVGDIEREDKDDGKGLDEDFEGEMEQATAKADTSSKAIQLDEHPPHFSITSETSDGFRRSQETINRLVGLRKILNVKSPLVPVGEHTNGGDPDFRPDPPNQVSTISRSFVVESLTSVPLVSSNAWADADSSRDISENSDCCRESDSQDFDHEKTTHTEPLPIILPPIARANLKKPARDLSSTPKKSSKNPTKPQMMSGIARRIGRVVESPATKRAPDSSIADSPLTILANSTRTAHQLAAKSPAPKFLKPCVKSPSISLSSRLIPSSKTPGTRPRSKTEVSPRPSAPQDSTLFSGKRFLHRWASTPTPSTKVKSSPVTPCTRQSSCKSQPSKQHPVTLQRARSNTVGSPLPPTLSTPSPQALSDPSGRSLIATRLENLNAIVATKRSINTVNFSPPKRSPLGMNSVCASSQPTLFSDETLISKKSGEGQTPTLKKTGKAVVDTPQRSGPATSTCSRVPTFAGRTPRPSAGSRSSGASTPSQPLKRAAPTAPTSGKAVHLPSKTGRRMTNSVKPLIPLWTGSEMPSPELTRNLFRNSLKMVR